MNIEKFNTQIFELFHKKWALLTAGTEDHFNSMTIAWGTMGTVWSKPVVTVYVNPLRYTYDFMNKNELFTVGFFSEEYRQALNLMGTRSGRDGDPLKGTSLTPCYLDKAVYYKEAEITFVCQKLYEQNWDKAAIPQEIAEHYYAPTHLPHRTYIGEVIKIIEK